MAERVLDYTDGSGRNTTSQRIKNDNNRIVGTSLAGESYAARTGDKTGAGYNAGGVTKGGKTLTTHDFNVYPIENPVVPDTPLGNAGSNGGSRSAGTYVDPNQAKMDELWALFQKQNEEARQNRLNAIMAQLQATKDAYGLQQRQIGDEYDKLVDQNEVRKYRAMRALRENQANRGIDTSGLGRQEGLLLDTNYNNKTIDIKRTKQQAIDEIANLMTQAEAEAANNKATVNDTYDNALLQWRLANLT